MRLHGADGEILARAPFALELSGRAKCSIFRRTPITLVFSREFKDWHLQGENGFNRLLGNCC